LALLAAAAACGPRQVEVGTGTAPAGSEIPLTVTNNDTQGVNVYYVIAGNQTLVGEVAARSTQTLTVRGLSNGSSVTLRAARKDGSRAYDRNVVLNGPYAWTIP
jgi:hypothetical protein